MSVMGSSLTLFVLKHPQSQDLYDGENSELVRTVRIACGTTVVANADLSEAADFHPTFATWNSTFFETSVLLTVWRHAAELIRTSHVAFLHSDVTQREPWVETLASADQRSAIGLTIPWHADPRGVAVDSDRYRYRRDPMLLHSFDAQMRVWDEVRRLDRDAWEYAEAENPPLVYSHQFLCPTPTFLNLAAYLYKHASRLRFHECGLWTPHVFERLLALWLARHTTTKLTAAFLHHGSSSATGPGEHGLYGPRPLRYLQLCPML